MARSEYERHDGLGLIYPETELVFGLVSPVGTDFTGVQQKLENHLKRFKYKPTTLSLSSYIGNIVPMIPSIGVTLKEDDEFERISTHMTAGNRLRELTGYPEFVAMAAVAGMSAKRKTENGSRVPSEKTAYILKSLKRPEEVNLLRRIYGVGFFLIGIFASEEARTSYLIKDKNLTPEQAQDLINRDANEADPDGQRTRDTFQLADVFVHLRGEEYKPQLERFLDLVFGCPAITPSQDEHAMFLAYSASLRSGQLARQVGAALRNQNGDIVSVGCNDVPAAGGGLYWPDQKNDQRDNIRKIDSNDQQLKEILSDVLDRMKTHISVNSLPTSPSTLFKDSLLMDVSEFGRAVHAEMDAILTAARSGVSPRGGELFTTTFPCHNCTRHIITSGISRVVYIEPYPKSMAAKLHEDAVAIVDKRPAKSSDASKKVPFEPFVGIGPRRFFDLFSMKLSRGYEMRRKIEGKMVDWNHSGAPARFQMLPTSYLQREQLVTATVKQETDKMLKQGSLI